MHTYREGVTLAIPGGVVMGFADPFEFLLHNLPDWTSEAGTCWAQGQVDGAEGMWTLRLPVDLPQAHPAVVYGARHNFVGSGLVRSFVLAQQLPSRFARTSWPAP